MSDVHQIADDEAREQGRRTETRFKRFIDSNLIGMVTCYENGSMSEANDVFLTLLGYTRGELESGSVNWKMITAPEFSSRALEAVEQLKATGVFSAFHAEYLRKTGERVPVLVGGAAMSQSPLEWMCFVLDQTEQKKLEESNNRERDQRELLEHEIRAREEERRRIARELHDETGQMMASLLAGLRAIEDAKSLKKAKAQANELRQIAASAIDELGRVSRGLHPFTLDDHGLAIALRNYTDEYSKVQGLRVTLHVKGLEVRRLTSPLEVALYRISQEALTNISKHAEAKSVEITLDVGEEFLDFEISDDGRGFNVKKLQADYSGKHLGLRSMRERAVLLGGEFTIESRDGGGTVKTFRIPVAFACDIS